MSYFERRVTHYCFLPLPLSLLSPFKLALLVVPAVLFPLQPFMLVFLVAVVPARERRHVTSARPLNSPFLLTPTETNSRQSPRTPGKRHVNKTSLCHHRDCGGSAGEWHGRGAGQLQLSAQLHMSLLSA